MLRYLLKVFLVILLLTLTMCFSLRVTFGDGGLPESDHGYYDDTDQTWTYTLPGNPGRILVTFDPLTQVEDGCDWINIYDGSWNLIGSYTGSSLAGSMPTGSQPPS